MATIENDRPRLRPVSPVKTDQFTVYVANLKNYGKTAQIEANPNVELCYMSPDHDQVRIEGTALEDLGFLSSLESVGKEFMLKDNPALVSVAGLEKLNSLGTGAEISNNSILQNLDSLSALTQIGGRLQVSSCGGLRSINLPELTSITSDLRLSELGALTTFSAPKLELIGGELDVSFVSVTEMVLFTPSLGGIRIEDNADLTSISLPEAQWVNRVIVVGNTLLETLSLPLANMHSQATNEHHITIEDNPQLTTIDLTSFTRAHDSVRINNNDSLLNLNGLSSLASAENLHIKRNQRLNTVTGLASLQTLGTWGPSGLPWVSLEVSDNPSLPCSDIEQLVAQLGNPSVNGSRNDNNLNGCGL